MAHPEYSLMEWTADVAVVEKWKSIIMEHWHSKWKTYCNPPAPQPAATIEPVSKNYGDKNVAAADEWVSSANIELLQSKMYNYLNWKPNTNLLAEFVKFIGVESRKVSHWCKAYTSLKGGKIVNEELNKYQDEQERKKNIHHATWNDLRTDIPVRKGIATSTAFVKPEYLP